jgi:competence protein ComEA
MKNSFKQYFTFSRREQHGLIVLILILGALIAATYINPLESKEDNSPPLSFQQSVDSFLNTPAIILNKAANNLKFDNNSKPGEIPISLFPFDPNTIDEKGLLQLGIKPWVIKAIINYRNAGGKFRQPSDLQKIYSLKEEDYRRIETFIAIKEVDNQAKKRDTVYPARYKKPADLILEINGADSSALTLLSGIGPSFASRIVKYRKRLGGFTNKTQLLEVFGMDSEKYRVFEKQIIVDSTKVERVDVNNVTFKNLMKHPYFEYHIVKSIVEYRQKNGGFSSVAELKAVNLMYDELYLKIRPYIIVGVYTPQTDKRQK